MKNKDMPTMPVVAMDDITDDGGNYCGEYERTFKGLTMHKGDLVECLYVGKGIGKECIYQVTSGCHRGEIDRVIGTHALRPLKTQEKKDREAFILEGLTLQPVLTVEHAGIIEHALGLAFDAGFKAPDGR